MAEKLTFNIYEWQQEVLGQIQQGYLEYNIDKMNNGWALVNYEIEKALNEIALKKLEIRSASEAIGEMKLSRFSWGDSFNKGATDDKVMDYFEAMKKCAEKSDTKGIDRNAKKIDKLKNKSFKLSKIIKFKDTFTQNFVSTLKDRMFRLESEIIAYKEYLKALRYCREQLRLERHSYKVDENVKNIVTRFNISKQAAQLLARKFDDEEIAELLLMSDLELTSTVDYLRGVRK
jgi:hypothetical protein